MGAIPWRIDRDEQVSGWRFTDFFASKAGSVTYLILSDIHSNMSALEAVLADSEGQYESVICCGDLVGYGPDPQAVVDWAMKTPGISIRGNHDRVCAGTKSDEQFNGAAQTAVDWTRTVLSTDALAYLRALPEGPVQQKGIDVCHGSPQDEDEYLSNAADASRAAHSAQAQVTLFGHTHRQGGFVARRKVNLPMPHMREGRGRLHALDAGFSSVFPFRSLKRGETEAELVLEDPYIYLLNPGSVGQPRDRDPRAAYCLYTPENRLARFCRVPYDIAETQRRIQQIGLPYWLAARLEGGR